MASRKSPYMYSPSCGTMPNTYRKLSSSWDAKTGTRDHLANVFCNTVKSDAVLHPGDYDVAAQRPSREFGYAEGAPVR